MTCQQGTLPLAGTPTLEAPPFFTGKYRNRPGPPGSLPKHTGNMAAVVAPSAILTTRVVAPKARAARTLKATAFKGAKLAQPKVSDPRLSSGVISFRDI